MDNSSHIRPTYSSLIGERSGPVASATDVGAGRTQRDLLTPLSHAALSLLLIKPLAADRNFSIYETSVDTFSPAAEESIHSPFSF